MKTSIQRTITKIKELEKFLNDLDTIQYHDFTDYDKHCLFITKQTAIRWLHRLYDDLLDNIY